MQLTRQISLAVSALSLAASAFAQQQGPEQTTAQLEAGKGPFTVATAKIASPTGYGGGTVYYPTNASGKVGLIVVAPGFTETQSAMNMWGPILASNGFAVVNIDTKTVLDQPPSRATQMMAALKQVGDLSKSVGTPYYNKIDTTREGVMGHSMGGGGTLIAAKDNPSLKAAIPAAPWSLATKNFPTLTVPTIIFACQSDVIAPVSGHTDRFWASFNSELPSALAEFAGAGHQCPTSMGGADRKLVFGKLGIAWFKRFIDGDTRYTQFLVTDTRLSRFLVKGSF
jgi:dienelactone hydrolase